MPSNEPNRLTLAKRDAMIDIAIGVVAEGGLSALTFRRLAQAAGTSTAPFTTEFGTRQELLRATLERCWADLAIQDEDFDDADVLASLRTALLRAVPATEPVPPELRAYVDLLVAATHDPDLQHTLLEIEAAQSPAYVELITQVQAAGHIPAAKDPEDLLAALWSLSDGLLVAHALDPDGFPPARVRSIWETSFAALIA